MPREVVTVQVNSKSLLECKELEHCLVGQAGNQLAGRFWELALREHAAANPNGLFDESLSTFFRNVDGRQGTARDLPARPDNPLPIVNLQARAVLVDMECGVLDSLRKGSLGELFDSRQLLTDVSGAGNNWAHGHSLYGPQYRERLSDLLRTQAEACDSLQGFLLMHSLGGGTGSGLGSYILEMLEDEYPAALRFAASVFPSQDDDVVTSPYNALLSLSRLAAHADVALPLENQALQKVCAAVDARAALMRPGSSVTGTTRPARASSSGRGSGASSGGAFDAMNGVAASALLNLTASARFEGPLNVDLNEISMNLVPFPRMHFLISSLAPHAAPRDVGRLAPGAPRSLDQLFQDAFFSSSHRLVKADPRHSTYLACGLLVRGAATPADLARSIGRIRRQIRMPPWNEDAFKTGTCAQPPEGLPLSLFSLANNCAIGSTFLAMQQRFQKLFRKRTYVHHYTEYMEAAEFEAAHEAASALMEDYALLNDTSRLPAWDRFSSPAGAGAVNCKR